MTRIHRGLALLCASLVLACSDSGTEPEQPKSGPVALRIAPDAPALHLGESVKLDVEFVDAAGKPVAGTGSVTWSSSDPNVISADEGGVITARAFGSATITASAGSLEGSTKAVVRMPTASIGSNTPSSASLGADGGEISATATDGTRYTLIVPRHALAEETTITITPLAAIQGFPAKSGASTALQFEPDGLAFSIPAELVIVSPTTFKPSTIAFSQSGDSFTLAPAAISGDTARVMVEHFSSSGTAAPTAEETAALAPAGSDPASAARHGIAQENNRAAEAGEHPNVGVIEQHLLAWFENGVMPALEAATNGVTDTEAALSQWLSWWSNVQLWADGRLEAETDEAYDAALDALRAEMDRLNQRCADNNDPTLMYEILHFAGMAAQFGFDRVDSSLELDAVIENLCVQLALEAVLPEPFEDGGTLEITAGISVGGRAPEFGFPVDITLTSLTTNLSPASGTVDGNGRFTSTVSLRDGESQVIVDVEAVNAAFPMMRTSKTVTASVDYELDLTVDGGDQTTIETGEHAWLNVFVQKAQAPVSGTVTLAIVDGSGSIEPASVQTDAHGVGSAVYMAPDDPDTVRVRATYSDGGRTLTDSVTIYVKGTPRGHIDVQSIYQAWYMSANALAPNVPSVFDALNGNTSSAGTLVGAYTASASVGGASGSGGMHHSSEVKLPSDSTLLLEVHSNGGAEGTVSASRQAETGAVVDGASGAHVFFEVLEAPVYYEITAHGHTSGAAGSEVVLSTRGAGNNWNNVFRKAWHAAPDSLVESGWIPPGVYRFDGGGNVMMGAGKNNSNGDNSASGSMSYVYTFRIYDREPKKEETP